jgi:selenocysteine-specific elongation factor
VLARLRALERGEAPPEPPRPERRPAGAAEPPRLDDAALQLAALLRADGPEPRADADLAAAAGLSPAGALPRLAALERAGQAVRAGRSLHFDPQALEALVAQAVAVCERDGSVSIAGLRDELGTSRKYAQAVLEHMDAEKITVRRGDEHVLRRRRRA